MNLFLYVLIEGLAVRSEIVWHYFICICICIFFGMFLIEEPRMEGIGMLIPRLAFIRFSILTCVCFCFFVSLHLCDGGAKGEKDREFKYRDQHDPIQHFDLCLFSGGASIYRSYLLF